MEDGPRRHENPFYRRLSHLCTILGIYICTPFVLLLLLPSQLRKAWYAHQRKRSHFKLLKEMESSRSALVLRGSRYQGSGPTWPGRRAHPITPPPSSAPSATSGSGEFKTIQQTSIFFTKLPLEVRKRVYDIALGEEMLELEVSGTKLDIWRCNAMERRFWSEGNMWDKAYDIHWEWTRLLSRKEHQESREHSPYSANISLLGTCRQVYLEAVSSICASQVLVLAIGPRENLPLYKPTLLYLPYFILPQRLNEPRYLYIHWILDPPEIRHIGISHATNFWWKECWGFLAKLPGLHELLIRFEGRDEQHLRWGWAPLEAGLAEYISKIHVRKRFVVVLPFPDGNLDLDVGDSTCDIIIPS
ncbi:hypothetical protein BU23DRAFT_603849 [Bimuria novae-zelandiae CBS 107.79]|uniref:DUF7730 domain-containing protein n=1 Tax=Bimuria novae-zelandiae CBS 107.79 TaxID=1447943 RepID=A0A6A5ULV9_9PLEO|nr:hypothetical protein BU23DRAFT_603849 [Bimuria novae-zelandiae CBS 107.79]